jgi:hypothetical protein
MSRLCQLQLQLAPLNERFLFWCPNGQDARVLPITPADLSFYYGCTEFSSYCVVIWLSQASFGPKDISTDEWVWQSRPLSFALNTQRVAESSITVGLWGRFDVLVIMYIIIGSDRYIWKFYNLRSQLISMDYNIYVLEARFSCFSKQFVLWEVF